MSKILLILIFIMITGKYELINIALCLIDGSI